MFPVHILSFWHLKHLVEVRLCLEGHSFTHGMNWPAESPMNHLDIQQVHSPHLPPDWWKPPISIDCTVLIMLCYPKITPLMNELQLLQWWAMCFWQMKLCNTYLIEVFDVLPIFFYFFLLLCQHINYETSHCVTDHSEVWLLWMKNKQFLPQRN